MKKIREIKKSREEKYDNYKELINECRDHMNSINKILPKLIEMQNEMLNFMETAFNIKDEIEVPIPEEEE